MRPSALAVLLLLAVPAVHAAPDASLHAAFQAVLGDLRSGGSDLKVLPAPLAPAAAALSGSEQDRLLALLGDKDPEVRRLAVRDLRYFLFDADVKDKLEAIAGESSREVASVRKEAVKSLARNTNDLQIKDFVKDLAARSRETYVRVIAMKGLYFAAAMDADVRAWLLSEARSESDRAVRLAAVWGLWDAAQLDSGVKEALRDMLRRRGDDGLRIEALKSLYVAMGDYQLKDEVISVAKDSAESTALRATALLALSAVYQDYAVKDYLQAVAERESEPALRQAAVRAREGWSVELLQFFHVGWRTSPYQPYHDPLDNE